MEKKVCEGGFHGFGVPAAVQGGKKCVLSWYPNSSQCGPGGSGFVGLDLTKKKIKITQLQQKRCFFFLGKRSMRLSVREF